MEKRNLIIRFSVIFLLTIFITAMVLKTPQVDAAPKFNLNTSQITVTTGMTQVLKVKNVKAKYKIKWYSSNKSIAIVNSKGVVKGIKDGKTTIKCVVTASGKKSVLKCPVIVKTPQFAKTSYTITKGGNVQLSLKNIYSKSSYKWYTENASIVKVNSKGKVVGVGVGKTKVSVKIYIPKISTRSAKVIVRKVNIIVKSSVTNKSVTVSNQKELTKALLDKNVCQITIKTDDKVVLTIPQGNYSKVKMNVDAPNADIINNGVFKEILIKKIATDTWTEKAKGNVLILDAAAGHIVIPKTSNIKQIQIVNANSNFKLDVQGDIDKITIDSPSKVEINITGTVGSVDVNSRATVSVDGTSKEPIEVKVSEKADGTTLNSNVKVDVTSGSDTEINLSKGAEESSVKTTNEDKSVEVTNNTDSAVSIDNGAGGKNQTVEAGKNATVDGKGNVTNSTTDNKEETNTSGGGSGGGSSSGGGGSSSGGSSTGGGATSSGDLTRVVERFQTFNAIDAYTNDGRLKTEDELKEEFPKKVIGYSNNDKNVTFDIKSWHNEEGYSNINAVPGCYKFVAVLGKGDIPSTIREDLEVIIKVMVIPEDENIIYKGTVEELRKIKYESKKEISNGLEYEYQYTGDTYVSVNFSISYYNLKGDYVATTGYETYFSAGETKKVFLAFPTDIDYNILEHDDHIISIGVKKAEKLQSVKEQITIEQYKKIKDERIHYLFALPVIYEGDITIFDGEVVIYYWKEDKVIFIERKSLCDMVGHDTKEFMLCWWEESHEYYKADNITAYVDYANTYIVDEDENIVDKSIIYNSYNDSEVNKFSIVEGSEQKLDKNLLLTLNYTGVPYVNACINIKYYDNQNNFIQKTYQYLHFKKDDVNKVSLPLPHKSNGEVVPYDKYMISIDATQVNGGMPSLSQVNVNKIGDAQIEDISDGKKVYSQKLSIANIGITEVYDIGLFIKFYKGEDLIYAYNYEHGSILGEDSETIKAVWVGKEENLPDRMEYDVAYAYKSNASINENVENHKINYVNKFYTEANKFEFVKDKIINNKLLLKLKYEGELYIGSRISIDYYSSEGELISTTSNYLNFNKGDEKDLLFNIPRKSNGEFISYAAYEINIETESVYGYTDAREKITVGVPSNFIFDEEDMLGMKWYSCKASITNIGTETIHGAKFRVYYWKEGELVDVSSGYIFEIKPGKTEDLSITWETLEDNPVLPDSITIEKVEADAIID